MQKAAETAPPFDLDQATVSLAIKVDNDGKVSLIASGSGTAGGTGNCGVND
jgi:hypothetical protein